jgi:ribosome-binding protein aMBF1 (putative translation factor)
VPEFNRRFAEHLRTLIDERGLRVADLALEIGRGDEVIYQYLRGKALPSVEVIVALGRALGLRDYRKVLPPTK